MKSVKKATYCIIPIIWKSRKDKMIEAVNEERGKSWKGKAPGICLDVLLQTLHLSGLHSNQLNAHEIFEERILDQTF